MSKSEKTLYLFTAEFPYGNKSETFLETEIIFLAKSFQKVIVIPSKKTDVKRLIPANVSVIDDLVDLKFSKYQKIIQLFFHPIVLLNIFFLEVQTKGFKTVFKFRKLLLDYLACELLKVRLLKNNRTIINGNSLYYTYWFCNSTLALSILKYKSPKIKFISRTHRFDLYDEVWGDMGLPFRAFQSQNIDKIYCISKEGQEYFKNKVSDEFHSKIELSYLGVNQYAQLDSKTQDGYKVIVSCAGLIPIKNVDKIVDLIKKSTELIHWIHFGDGSEKEKLLRKIQELPENITFDFKGHVNNEEVVSFYQNHQVDLFISLSSSEGLPVSMMEALSFGVPILSTNVGGVAEIVVNERTGFLIELQDDLLSKREVFKRALFHDFKKEEITSVYNLKFNATSNYNCFIERIKLT